MSESGSTAPGLWLAHDSEMSEMIRTCDWSKTPLGPMDTWSPALRMMTRFLMANRFPLLLWWGPSYISIYNDAYRPILGAKHPWALGQPVSTCWSEIWPILKPLIDSPFNGGPATWNEDLFLELNRFGFIEETHFTVAYSPVPDELTASGIGGVLATVHEITATVVGERRIGALRDLSARSLEAKSALEACRIAAETLAKYDKDVPFAQIYLLDGDGRRARLVADTGLPAKASRGDAVIELASGNAQRWPIGEAVRDAKMRVVDDLKARLGPDGPAGPWSDPPREAVIVPIRSTHAETPNAVLVAGVSVRLKLDAAYRDFYELLASQIAAALTHGLSYDEERKRSEALAEIDRAKTVFFSNVSHEFRTPLTLILGPVENLLEPQSLETPLSTQKEQLGLVRRNALRLQRLVNTMLDFSRIEAGRMRAHYEETDLAAFTAELVSNFRSACERAGLSLTIDCPSPPFGTLPAYVDRDMWEKVVLNLMSNAFKFTLQGGVTVRLTVDGEHVVLQVKDTGVGIPSDELPLIFQRFHRVEGARGRTHEGSGIGLALVSELVKLHGGCIKVESEIDHGSTFTVRLPLGKAHLDPACVASSAAPISRRDGAAPYIEEALQWLPQPIDRDSDDIEIHSAPIRAGSKKQLPRILWADDNADMRAYVARLLTQRFEVETACHGEEALEKARKMCQDGCPPDLVLCDIMMPRLDGFGVLRLLRSDADLASVPVVLLSARAGEEARIEGLEAGADGYITKPFSARELLSSLDAQISSVAVRRKAEQSIRESEERYRAFTSATNDVMYRMSPDWSVMRRLKGRGFVPDTLDPSDSWFAKYIPPEEHAHLKKAIDRAIQTKSIFELEHGVIQSDGEIGWVHSRAVPIFDKAGDVVEWFGAAQDVTEQRRIKNELARAQNILQEAQRIAHVGSFEFHAATSGIAWSEEEYRIYGINPAGPPPSYEALIGQCIHPEDRELLHDTFMKAFASHSIYELEHRIVRPTGEVRWVFDRAQPFFDEKGKLKQYVGVTMDITERKLSELALRESEERLRLALSAANMAVWDWHIETGKVLWNDEHYTLLGYTPGSVTPSYQSWRSRVMPDDLERIEAIIQTSLRTGADYKAVFRVLGKNDVIRWIEAHGRVERSPVGTAVRLYGVLFDVTDRLMREQDVRQRLEEIEALYNNAPLGLALVDKDLRYLRINAALARINGAPATAHIEKILSV